MEAKEKNGAATAKANGAAKTVSVKEVCGIIMPISGSDGYPKEHWAEVKNILDEVIEGANFTPNLVSDANEIGIIHNRIVDNLYNNPIIICDVSSKNPNVMFELGLRLAFDKATIIIKDELTNYSFDTGIIEHLTYPSSLHYASINSFKIKLASKLRDTYAASKDSKYSTFLKNFVQYKSKLDEKEVGSEALILKHMEDHSKELASLRQLIKAQEKNGLSSIDSSKNDFSSLIRQFLDTNNVTKKEEIDFDKLFYFVTSNITTSEEVSYPALEKAVEQSLFFKEVARNIFRKKSAS